MTIQELINQLQEAIQMGYKPDTHICVDTMPDVTEEETYWGISLDTDSSVYPDKDQWKISLNVFECEDFPKTQEEASNRQSVGRAIRKANCSLSKMR